jgi:hypothetical protein
MIAAVLLGLALQADPRVRILAVRGETVDGRSAVRVVATAPLTRVTPRRISDELSLTFDADPAPGLPVLVPVLPPVTGGRVDRDQGGVTLRLRVPFAVPYDVRREASGAVVLFGAPVAAVPSPSAPPPAAPSAASAAPPRQASPPPPVPEPPAPTPSPSPDVAELYKRILPPPPPDVPGLPPADAPGAGGQVAVPGTGAEGERTGWVLGPLALHPALSATYVDAEGTILDTPEPVRDRYLEVQPRLLFELLLWKLKLQSDYAPRFRFGSEFEQFGTTTHAGQVDLEVPLGARVLVRGSERYARGTLETTEVDPGREYFFQLGRYVSRTHHAGVRLDTSALLDLDVAGTLTQVRVDDRAGFFDHDTQSLTAAAAYDVRPTLTSFFGYTFSRTPPSAERPLIESTGHTAEVRLQGEVLPLVDGEARVGYEWQEAPFAAPGGQRYRGLVASLKLSKAFAPDTRLQVQGERATYASAFEGNAFYVANSVQADLTAPAPFEVSLHLGGGYHRNDYRTVAPEIGRPRRDRLLGWSVGLGRPFTRWAYVRADFRKERRDSNVDSFDSRSRAFTVQMGIGAFRPSGTR